jgi:anaerobic selenocysteine-containing dehydrogenase
MAKITRKNFLGLTTAALAVTPLTADEKKDLTVPVIPEIKTDYGTEKQVPLLCRMCAQFCPMIAHVKDGKLIRIESNKKVPLGGVCGRGRAAISALYNPDRVKTPLIRTGERGNGEFREASWDEALKMVGDKLKSLRESGEARAVSYFPRFNAARGLDSEFFQILGTPNIIGYADACFANSLTLSYGAILGGNDDKGLPTAGSSDLTPDYENAKYGILISRNPGGGLVTFAWGAGFGKGKKNGLKVTCVDPRKPSEVGESDADWVSIRPGTDVAFLLGIMNEIITKKFYDVSYLLKNTNAAMLIEDSTGLPVETKIIKDEKGKELTDFIVYDEESKEFKFSSEAKKPALNGSYTYTGKKVQTAFSLIEKNVKTYTPEWAQTKSDVPSKKIKSIAERLNTNKPAVFIERGYRSCRYSNSMEEKKLILMLNALLGTLGSKGGLIFQRSIRLGKIMDTPKTKDKSVAEYYRKQPDFALINTKDCRRFYFKSILDGKPYKNKVAVFYGQNPVGGSTGSSKIIEAIKQLEMIVAITPFHSETTMYADVILPECTFMERDEAIHTQFKCAFPFAAVHRKAVEPLYQSKNGFWIYNELAKRTFPADEYKKYFGEYDKRGIEYIWSKQLAKIENLNDKEKTTFSAEKLLQEGVWAGETSYKVRVKTPSGKIELYSTFFAKSYKDLKEAKNKYAIHSSPLPNWIEPFWMQKRKKLNKDEFIPITAFSPISTFTGAQTRDNVILGEIGKKIDWDAVYVNSAKGKALGLKDGGTVEIFNIDLPEMKVKSKVIFTDSVHPDSLFSWYGPGAGYYKAQGNLLKNAPVSGLNPNHISSFLFAPLDGGQPAQDFIVKIRRA